MRITDKDLEAVAARINRSLGTPATPYSKREDGTFGPNARNYHISYAYGGAGLCRMADQGSGTHDVFRCGHVPKRELYDRMQAFLDGLEAGCDLMREHVA